MKRAVDLAKKAGNATRPNPRVGAVLVKGAKLQGVGFHRRAGEPHAEVMALRNAGARAKGADLYVTMEPCSTHGRTPPCTRAIMDAGVKRVIYGSRDVDPRNRAKADRILKTAGIGAVRGFLEKECDQINEDYRHWTTRDEPWVILKLAMTLDGYLAVPGRRWITGPEAREEVQRIRAGCDAILVGAETVRKDNPRLTIRKGRVKEQPWRVVVTRSGKLPGRARIFNDAHRDRTVIYQNRSWNSVLKDLYRKGVRRLLVEGGAKIAAALISEGKVNEVVLFFAPGTAKQGFPRLVEWVGWNWGQAVATKVGRDLCLHGILKGVN